MKVIPPLLFYKFTIIILCVCVKVYIILILYIEMQNSEFLLFMNAFEHGLRCQGWAAERDFFYQIDSAWTRMNLFSSN